MSQDLLNPTQQQDATNAGRRSRNSRLDNTQINRIAGLKPDIKNLSEDGKAKLHSDPSAMPRAIAKAGVDIVDTSAKSTIGIFRSVFENIKERIESGNVNPNTKNIVFSLVGGAFGLNAIRKLMDLPKLVSNKGFRDSSSPLILDAAKLVTGTALSVGLLKGVLGGVGLSPGGIGVGLAAFIGLNALTSIYENPNSIFGKLAGVFGLRTKAVSLMDTVKFESTSENNIEATV